ncbi:MAG: PEGA domain-containing protein [Acidobacteria bacterium]|nr:MAG: PEGA domain-containing protein [Acidobacteriota bacterium]
MIVVSPQRQPTVVYPPWYGPWGYPWGWGWGYPYPYQYPYRYYSDDSDLRIQATPRETEVYVDGARAGIVDDFDGVFQRLHLRPGDHEITLYLAGYRTWSERRYFGPHSDQRILHTMLPLAPGQPDEPRPVPRYPIPDRDRGEPLPDPRVPPRSAPRDLPREEPRAPETPVVDPRAFGTLSVGVRPADAEITLDGQKQSLTSADRFVIQLPEGVHHLVIKKNGYDTFETDLQIRRGRTLSFEVNLVR